MLKHRVISAVLILAVVFGGAAFLPAAGLFVIVLGLGLLGTYEFVSFLRAARFPHHPRLILAGTVVLLVSLFASLRYGVDWTPEEVEVAVLVAYVAAVCAVPVLVPVAGNAMHGVFSSIAALLYVPFFIGFLVKLLFAWPGGEGRALVLYLIFVVKVSDIGAYFVGCRFGRHKLNPRISPAKSWEGCAGGVAAALAMSLAFVAAVKGDLGVVRMTWTDAIALGLLLPVVGMVGDLVESMFKRAAEVKDSSAMVRGMGGWLDVLDSLLYTAPVLYLYARAFL